MSLCGYLGGSQLLNLLGCWLDDYASKVASILLLFIGSKMIYDVVVEDVDDSRPGHITHRVMLLLAIATSIDAIAGGFSLTLFPLDPLLLVLVIGIFTFFLSGTGVLWIGAKSGTWLESKAGLLGGTVLLLMGVKMAV